MKKFIFIMITAIAIACGSCRNWGTTSNKCDSDSLNTDSIMTEKIVVDSISADSTLVVK